MVGSALKMPRIYPPEPETEVPSSSPAAAAIDATHGASGDDHPKSIVDLWVERSGKSVADDAASTTASSTLDGPRSIVFFMILMHRIWQTTSKKYNDCL